MFTENRKPRKRGRPRGRTAVGEDARRRLYAAAVSLIAERGYAAATLRDVAARAGVSPALLYRYFPSKQAVVLALYDELSGEFARRAQRLAPGKWRDRFQAALELSLEVLGPHRRALRALAPVITGGVEESVFAPGTAFSRLRVQEVFQQAVAGAADAPPRALAEALGRLLYLAHLAIVLWWLLDRSPGQRATAALAGLIRQALPWFAAALRLPRVRSMVRTADLLFAEALLGVHE
jgi:AcrR family transcriptional regulator